MKAVGKWLAKVLASAAVILLVILLLPYATRLGERFLPDLSDRAVTASQVLSQRFEESARLETLHIEEEGVLNSSTSALFLGTVRQVAIQYRYEASMGIDLRTVGLLAESGRLTLLLPPMEVLTDSITVLSIDRDDFWYPLSDTPREALLAQERLACRARHLAERNASEDAWRQTCRMLDTTIAQWLGDVSGLTIRYEHAEATTEAPET